jgi:hypothetical protein
MPMLHIEHTPIKLALPFPDFAKSSLRHAR